jgi:hypothetical protein
MISAVRTSFRPQESKFLTLETGDVMTKAMMCRSCGVIEIIGDVNKLRRLTSEPDSKTERFAAKDGGGTPPAGGDADRFPKAVNE